MRAVISYVTMIRDAFGYARMMMRALLDGATLLRHAVYAAIRHTCCDYARAIAALFADFCAYAALPALMPPIGDVFAYDADDVCRYDAAWLLHVAITLLILRAVCHAAIAAVTPRCSLFAFRCRHAIRHYLPCRYIQLLMFFIFIVAAYAIFAADMLV